MCKINIDYIQPAQETGQLGSNLTRTQPNRKAAWPGNRPTGKQTDQDATQPGSSLTRKQANWEAAWPGRNPTGKQPNWEAALVTGKKKLWMSWLWLPLICCPVLQVKPCPGSQPPTWRTL